MIDTVDRQATGRKSLAKIGAALAMVGIIAFTAVNAPLPSTMADDEITETPENAYHNGYSVNVRVGGEFADIYSRTSGARYDTDNIGYCYGPDGKSSLDAGWLSTDEAKGYEDGTVMNVPLPSVVARPGYTFVGWVDEKGMHEPKWDAQTKVIQIEIPDDPTLRTTTLFAEFMDDEGNGYCSCGASEADFFSGRIEEFRSQDSSTANEGQAFIKRNLPLIYLIAIEVAFAAGMFIRREVLKNGKPSSVPAAEPSNDDNGPDHDDAVQPSDANDAQGSGVPDSADSE